MAIHQSNEHENIEKVFVNLETLRGQIENLKLQHATFVSRFESEQGTEKRRHDGIDKEIIETRSKMASEIEKVDNKFFDIIFNRQTGVAFILDRLMEKDKKRESQKKREIGLWIAVGLLILTKVFDLLTHK